MNRKSKRKSALIGNVTTGTGTASEQFQYGEKEEIKDSHSSSSSKKNKMYKLQRRGSIDSNRLESIRLTNKHDSRQKIKNPL